jgi:hypothetical protein
VKECGGYNDTKAIQRIREEKREIEIFKEGGEGSAREQKTK